VVWLAWVETFVLVSLFWVMSSVTSTAIAAAPTPTSTNAIQGRRRWSSS